MASPYGTMAKPKSKASLGTVLPRYARLSSSLLAAKKERVGDDASVSSNDSLHSPAPARPDYTDSLGNEATLFRITHRPYPDSECAFTLNSGQQPALLQAMSKIFNDEVEAGDTYPHEFTVDQEGFVSYFMGGDGFVLLRGRYAYASDVVPLAKAEDWDERLLGFFYVKPNFPICNGGFMVNPTHRGKGVGGIMARAYLRVAPVLGYKASMFNLVFVSNQASIRLWQRLGFREIGRIPQAGRLRGQGPTKSKDDEGYVDAVMFYFDFESYSLPADIDDF
ncbi:hypothetical protein DFQ27_005346 [Actinomortierella ambigua]|uniref:N-acetyltransferase domain-containing protein n=1 Tax=Actinomortierella ambigua TaxID=1343610 RepID=A0A9P6QJQ5_9FUNG|nr:hypothetical protein DFQ26_001855 [Actinomortierella ambigua]KAG0268907.1 hypothetical protein DFQ27_005346 [Actinomortierella ambigua]